MKNWKVILAVAAITSGAVAQNVIDSWDFDVPDTNDISVAQSYSDLGAGGKTWNDNNVSSIINSNAVLEGGGTNNTQNFFRSVTPSVRSGETSGKYQLSIDIVSADFANTAALDQSATFGAGVSKLGGSGSDDQLMRFQYQGGLNITNVNSSGVTNILADADQIQITVDSEGIGPETVDFALPGSSVSNLNFRQVYDLDAGTFEAYYTIAPAAEVLLHSGTLKADWNLGQLRINSQQNNGGAIWEAGDLFIFDNIELTQLVAPTPVEPPALSGVLEEWLFEEANGTQFDGLSNSAPEPYGLGNWSANKSYVYTTNGVLRIGNSGTQGAYRNSTLSAPGETNGLFELSWTFTAAELNGGDENGSSVGFGFRDNNLAKEACLVRLLQNNGDLKLQYLLGSAQTTMINLKTNELAGPVMVRIVADYDNDTADVFYTLDGEAEVQGAAGVSFPNADMSFDGVRLAGVLKSVDTGADSFIEVDNLKLSVVEPTSITTLVDEWDMDSNGQYQLSNNGLILPNSDTNVHQFAQVADDGIFVWAPTNASSFSAKTALSEPVVLTNNSVAKMTLRGTEIDWTADGSKASNFGIRLWDGSNYIGLKISDQGGASSDAIRISCEDTDGSNGNYGRFSTNGIASGDFYVTVEMDYNNNEIRLSGNWEWSPDGTSGVQTNSFDFAAAGLTELTQIQMRSANWTAGDKIVLDNLEIEYTTELEQEPDTPDSLYADWLAENGYTENTEPLEDANGNGVNNLTEYAIGGAANLPVPVVDGSYLIYVNVQWDELEAAARGLSYEVLQDENLAIAPGFSTNEVEFVGSVDGVPGEGYSTVTNRVPNTPDARFMKLDITLTP